MILNIDTHVVQIDDDDYRALEGYELIVVGGMNPYVVGKKKGHLYRVARLIRECPNKFIVTYKDGDGLNLVKSNLLVCTRSEAKRLTSRLVDPNKHFGVYQTPSGKWRSRVKLQGKRINLGTYDTEGEAVRAREEFVSSEEARLRMSREKSLFHQRLREADKAKNLSLEQDQLDLHSPQ